MTDRTTEPTIIHLVPHTHWDREWYEPFQTFRMRLVDLIDLLLERMAADPRLRFTLDGQAATVDDYLEVRPDAEPLIRQLIAERRLAIGPWQILMDEFLVSGETIIRNLELGWARAEALGGAMRVGYLPDMFGHIAQMPQILRRAGIDRAVVWRGVPAEIDRDTFRWRAPDGSEVIAEYLVGGYGNGAYLFDVPDRFSAKLAGYRAANAGFYGERSLLAMYGTDHAVPSPLLADLVEAVNAAEGDLRIQMETLADYAAREAADGDGADGGQPERRTWDGELRSGARANMLMNVTSARVDLKAATGRAERLLERYAEPLTALHGGPWPERLLELAWRRVVDNSAHDSICGCSHDAVVAQVLSRYAEVEQIATGIIRATTGRIASRLPVGSRAVINPSPIDRDDVVEFDVAVPPGWDGVALRVGSRVLPTQEVSRPEPIVADLRLRGHEIPEMFRRRRHGRELFGRLINGLVVEPAADVGDRRLTVVVDDVPDPPELDVEELLEAAEAAAAADPDASWNVIVRANDRRRLIARVPAPALGFAAAHEVDAGAAQPEAVADAVRVSSGSLSNGLVSVEVGRDGTFSLSGGGTSLQGVGRVVDGGDFGDSYNYGPPARDRLVDGPKRVDTTIVEHGPLRGEIEIVRRYDWPDGIAADGSSRSRTTVRTDVSTHLEIRAGEPFVRVRLRFENRSRDHRVRWHIPLPQRVTGSAAEGQFAVVERGLVMEGGHGEVPLPTFPARGFVAVEGISVLLDQMTEYEVVDGSDLALTALRSFGLISRNANPFREDPAGPEVPIPDAQLLGGRTFRFALYPHAGSWEAADTVRIAELYQQPFVVVRGTGAASDGSTVAAGLRVEGPGIVLSALRRRDDWLELRLVNESGSASKAVLHGRFDAAREVDLLGRDLRGLTSEPGRLRLDLGPWEIATVRLRPVAPQA